MFKIEYLLDPSSPTDSEPLGDLKICDDQGEIRIENTYIDSWLLSLLQFSSLPTKEGSANISILEELEPISVEVRNGKIYFFHANALVSGELSEFSTEISRAAREFISLIKAKQWDSCNSTISILDDLLRKPL
ncbi:hypothetical protein [Pseudomonas paralcaligenes]|uniref:hypothetical protein n=1 Tax=Pseudomonas paralcaligenes TaxID=2772558 RepID=UPI001C80587B|nr:hypothetical protein [Pseudomonas paralcaligenes]